MTRRERSDAQLDAEAAAPRHEQLITDLIEDHRHLYRADLQEYRLHASSGETGSDWTGDRRPVGREYGSNGHPATWTGLPFTPVFLRYIDWARDQEQVSIRPSFPGRHYAWSTAFWARWAECRRFHPEHHDRPEWRGSLCYQLIHFTIRREPPSGLEAACLILGLTPPRAGRTLRDGLLYIASYMDRQHNRQKETLKPLRERMGKDPNEVPLWRDRHQLERHGLGGLHREDCPQCRVAS